MDGSFTIDLPDDYLLQITARPGHLLWAPAAVRVSFETVSELRRPSAMEIHNATSARDSLEGLPDDLISQIMSTLGNNLRRPEALVGLTSTCKRFHEKAPLSPTELKRACAAETLEHSFETRPSPPELQSRGIIKGGLGQNISFVEAKVSLERAVVRKFAERALAKRPKTDELQKREHQKKGILLDAKSFVSPRLSLARAELQRKMMLEQRRKELASKLEKRPSSEELVSRGLLHSA